MPKKKKIVENVTSIAVIEPEIEVEPKIEAESELETEPRKHIVQIKTHMPVKGFNATVEIPVGEVIYWESTDTITYSFEVGHQIYMDNFVGRAVTIDKKTSIPREQTRKWMENLPNGMLDGEYFTSEVLSMYETE